MFGRLLSRLSRDIGIDLGTSNTLVFVKDKGIVISEPSVVAVNTRNDQIVAVGADARRMLGKTPPHIIATRPLVDGVISDFEVSEKMLKYFIDRVHSDSYAFSPRPRVVIGIPLGVTEVERKAVEDAALSAGAREVMLIEEPMAAALGARLPVREATGHMIVDIGGGTTEVAVISLGGVVVSRAMRVAGDELTEAIINYSREHFNLLLGESMAEEVKMKLASAVELEKPLEMKMRGRDLMTGLPKEAVITDAQVREATQKILKLMVESIKATIESTPPELVADIYERGIIMTGGGALMKGLDKLFSRELSVPVQVVDDPLTAVVRGTGVVLEDIEGTKDLILPSTQH
jgi:rod shape-determining protein MreB and related proteins